MLSMWHLADYRPTTLFSLRPANATTSGGKTLVAPTPFAIKMALLDSTIRVYGLATGERWFPIIRDLIVAVRLPPSLVVINTFIKILRPHKSGPKDTYGTGLEGPMGNTITYRELVHYGGQFSIALGTGSGSDEIPFATLLSHIHYMGKRGSFFQFTAYRQDDQLPDDFVLLNPEPGSPFLATGLLQIMDDCGPKMTFAHADIYSGKKIGIDKEDGRLLKPVVLPYQPVRSSRGFTLYTRNGT
jgi:hypothetical protein